MAKIKCSQCGTKYKGNFCPNCSAPAPEGKQRKKKNKILIPVLVLAVLVFLFSGNGGDEEVVQPSEAKEASAQSRKITVAETVIYEDHGITVTVGGWEDGLFGPEIPVTVINDSDQNVVVSTRYLSVNQFMMDTSSLYSDVAAGKKSMDNLTLMSSELSEAGIDTVAEIEFRLAVYDSDSYEDIDVSDLITVTTTAAEGFTQEVDDSGDVIYDKDDVRVICKGLKDDTFWDGCLVFLVENQTNELITVYGEDVSVNGFMVDESFWAELRPGTRKMDAMYILNLENLGLESIDQIDNIEFAIRIVDEKWHDIDKTDPVVLNFK